MDITTHSSWYVLFALLKRDFFIARTMIVRDLIDSSIALFIYYMVFGVFFPAWGMSNQVISAIFWGMCTLLLLNNAFDQAFRYSLDGATGMIRQFLVLPLSFRFFIIRCIISSMIEQVLITIPFIVGGFFLFSKFLTWNFTEIPGFIFVYSISLWCISAFGLLCGFLFSLDWNRDNLWIRIVMPISYISPLYYDWQSAWQFSKPIGILFMLSPLSYIAQGLRNLNLPPFISTWVCCGVLLLFSFLFTIGAGWSMKRRLDAVGDA